jgi:hypothetical protein
MWDGLCTDQSFKNLQHVLEKNTLKWTTAIHNNIAREIVDKSDRV